MTAPEDRIRVAVVDDQELIRVALRMMVESQPDLELVGEAADGTRRSRWCARAASTSCSWTCGCRSLDGIAATAAITRELPMTRVVALTTFDLDDYAFPAIRAGASGFLLKDARAEEIVDAIRTVHAGHGVVAPSTTRRLIEHVAITPTPDGTRAAEIRAALTARELDTLLEMATGDTNAEIARRLHLSEATVKTHVGHVLAKLGLRDRVQAVVLSYESGLVGPARG